MINSPQWLLFISFHVSYGKLVLHQDSILRLMFFQCCRLSVSLVTVGIVRRRYAMINSSENNLFRKEMKLNFDSLPLMRAFASRIPSIGCEG